MSTSKNSKGKSTSSLLRFDFKTTFKPRIRNKPITIEYQKKVDKCRASLAQIQEGWKTFNYEKVKKNKDSKSKQKKRL